MPPSQKTGAYFDQRENRRWVARLAAAHGGALLDVGCHIGGFALHAARAGVRAVGVDASTVVLEHATRNAEASGLEGLTFLSVNEPVLGLCLRIRIGRRSHRRVVKYGICYGELARPRELSRNDGEPSCR